VLSRQLLLADGKHFWPREIQQHKGAAADLHRALRAGPVRARRAELVGLGQTLSAWPLLAWLLVPLIVVAAGGFPLRQPAWVFWASAAAVGTFRWRAIRSGLGLRSSLLDEVRARFAGTPGSLSAIVAVVTGRLRPRRREAPSQPLLLIAAIISLATTVAFVGTRPSPSAMVTPLAIGLLQLILLWRLAAQSIAQGLWSRRTYRIRPSWDVRLDGRATSILDASLSGLGVVTDTEDVAIGATPAVSVTFPDGTGLVGRGVVVRTQKRPGGTVLGLSLEVNAEQHTSWMTHLLQDPAMTEPDGARESADPYKKRSWRTRLDRVAHAAILVAGALAFLAVGVLGFGYRPVTIVSPSMRPALSVGDVVIEQRASITSIHVGEIVTVPSSVTGGASLTHRVRNLALHDKSVQLETRGDANATSELFIVPRNTTVGRVVVEVPGVGHLLTKLSSEPVRWSAYGLAALLVIIVGLRKVLAAPSEQSYRRRAKYSL
jgi:signal peptidase I